MLRKLRRLAARGMRLSKLAMHWQRDLWCASYSRGDAPLAGIGKHAPKLANTMRGDEAITMRILASRYLSHRFDALGSGWRVWGLAQRTRVNRANQGRALQAAAKLPQSYTPIDWHLDCRGDYRFPPQRWARLIQPGPAPGVDIKVPWELSRMQHLVQLALLATDAASEPVLATRCEHEIHHQIRDFIAANPPRFGVNWRCAMDVAIRAANWVMAVSILIASGRDVTQLCGLLGTSLRDHGRYVVTHLEWHPDVRGNHYLANICGLVFIAAALPADAESNGWLAFATTEVLAEGERQVNIDGSGFEGSTSYHRLSIEMLAYTMALLSGVPASRWRQARDSGLPAGLPVGFKPADTAWERVLDDDGLMHPPPSLLNRLWRAAAFTENVMRPDGRALLIGDNDSGRFVKPCPRLEVLDAEQARRRYPDRYIDMDAHEDVRELGEDHRHLISAIRALFGHCDDSIDTRLIRWLSDGRSFQAPNTALPISPPTDSASSPPEACNSLRIPLDRRLDLEQITLHVYPGWGLYLWRGDGLLLSLRCGPLGLSGTGNHDHNDQLAITLHIDGRDVVADPGTFRYTADLSERDAYRSVRAHFAPRLSNGDREPGSLDEGVWRLGDQARARVEVVGERCLQGSHRGYDSVVHRRVELFYDHVLIRDWADGELELLSLEQQFAALNADGCALPYCPDYGVHRA